MKLVSADKIADVEPQDEVGALTRVGAYAGMAAAGLGAATLMGGIAVDFADVALVAGLYGVATGAFLSILPMCMFECCLRSDDLRLERLHGETK